MIKFKYKLVHRTSLLFEDCVNQANTYIITHIYNTYYNTFYNTCYNTYSGILNITHIGRAGVEKLKYMTIIIKLIRNYHVTREL